MSASKSKQKLSDRYSANPVNQSGDGSPKKKFNSKIALIAIIAVIAIIVVVVILLKGRGTDSEPDEYNVVVVPDNVKSNADNSNAAPKRYTASMNSDWTFTDARSGSANAYVANVTRNSNPVNFVVVRNDTQKVIYESPDIPVGGKLSNIKLDDESLKKGTYPCTLTYRLLDKNRKELSRVNFTVNIIIEND